jgi:hypothetical protein
MTQLPSTGGAGHRGNTLRTHVRSLRKLSHLKIGENFLPLIPGDVENRVSNVTDESLSQANIKP